MLPSEFVTYRMLHTIKVSTNMILIKTKIAFVDKYLFSLVSYRLTYTLCPFNFTPFVVGGDQWYFLFHEPSQFMGKL